jgi:hypothetical protein
MIRRLQMVKDAETGEEISLTESKWTKNDGRVNSDPRSIILMGTGRLLMEKSSAQPRAKSEMRSVRSNPLAVAYEEQGPANPLHNLKTNPIARAKLRPMEKYRPHLLLRTLSSQCDSSSTDPQPFSGAEPSFGSSQLSPHSIMFDHPPSSHLHITSKLDTPMLDGVKSTRNWGVLEQQYFDELWMWTQGLREAGRVKEGVDLVSTCRHLS